jgi:AcrR family transcriptional regulator
MARGRAADYADKRREIGDAAARLFAERGFAAVSISDIARACGCAKSLIYHYYPSKEQILADLLVTHVEALLAAAKAAQAASDSPREQFRAFLRGHMRLYADARYFHVLLLNSLPHLPEQERNQVRQIERELVAIATAILLRLVPTLEDKPQLLRPTAMNLYALINWTHVWYDAAGPLKPEGFADFAGDLFLDGLEKAVSRTEQPASPLPPSGRGTG